jgi:hypothetical protein
LCPLLITLLVAAPAAAQTLAPGAHGAGVKTLQRLLARDGFVLTIDGQYGPGTRRAVRAFQRGAGLAVTGTADDTTIATLRNQTGGSQALAPGTTPAPATTPPPSTTPPPATDAPAGQATLQDGSAIPPADAPDAVVAAIAGGNRIDTLPYLYGGGHKSFDDTAYDCSGAVSYVLHAAGLLDHTMTSGELASWGDPGPGRWMTIYANAGHTWIVVAGLRFDTSRYDSGPTVKESGPRWRLGPRPVKDFTVRHPTGF